MVSLFLFVDFFGYKTHRVLVKRLNPQRIHTGIFGPSGTNKDSPTPFPCMLMQRTEQGSRPRGVNQIAIDANGFGMSLFGPGFPNIQASTYCLRN